MPVYLIVLLVFCVISSTVFTVLSFKKTLLNLYLKTFSSMFFTILGLFSLYALLSKNNQIIADNRLIGGFLILLGLILCMIGDIILGLPRLSELKRDTMPVIIGGASWFFIGHVVYCSTLAVIFGINLYALIPLIPMCLIYTFANRKIGKLNYHGLTVGVLFYSLVESLTFAICIIALINSFTILALLLSIGFLLFYFSDMVLMHNYFGEKKRKLVSVLCHASYYPAQILIAISIFFLAT